MRDRLLRKLGSLLGKSSPHRGERSDPAKPAIALDQYSLKQMARMIVITRDDEIGCERCFQRLDIFVELQLAGKDAPRAMPLVHQHLECCHDCREEFEALLAALQGLT